MANEKRLIDADKLLEIYKKWIPQLSSEEDGGDRRGVETCIAVLEDMPTVDAVEVVRCEKCKHAVWDEEIKMWRCVESAEYDEEMGGYFGVCEYHYGDFFCFYGKRKDGDGNANANL